MPALFAKQYRVVWVIFLVVVLSPQPILGADTSPASRPSHWAQPIQLDGAPNLFKVSDTLYRSAQPSAQGMRNLKALGVKTIINLRSFHSDRDELKGLDLAYDDFYMKAWHPEEHEAVRFLQIVADSANAPVLVHCRHGADRTGVMVALYRVAVQGWSKQEAITEMTQGGYGFHDIWSNLVTWFERLDIESIKKQAGIT
jgi:protein tyrosine/serine phosphatase